MQRISNGTQATVLPVAGPVVGTPGFATGGIPGVVPATTIDPDSWNAVQEEIAHVIETSGIVLSKTDNTQLLAALSKLFLGTPSLRKMAWFDPIVDYGCVGDGVTDDTANFTAFLNDCITKKTPGRLPAARFKVSGAALATDVVAAEKCGLTLIGSGRQLTIVDVSACTASPQWGLFNSGGADFYVTMCDIGITGATTGTVFQVGKSDYSDAFNTPAFVRMNVNNTAPVAGAAVGFGQVIDGYVDIVANCSGQASGAALLLGRAQSCDFFGSAGNAAIGVHFDGSYNFGNNFFGVDIEAVGVIFQSDDVDAHDNNFFGGQFVWSQHLAVMNQAAGDFVLSKPNLSGVPDIQGACAQNVKIMDSGFGAMTFGGLNVVPALAADAAVNLDAMANYGAYKALKRAGVLQWANGMNAGGDFFVDRYVGGAKVDTPLYIDNANGQTTISTLQAQTFGSYGIAAPATRPVVTGSREGNATLASFLTAVASLGLINDQTTA